MNWKLTSVLAVICLVLGGVYLSWKPPATPPKPGLVPRLFASVPRDRVVRLEFAQAGSPEVVLERKPGITPGITWQLSRPVARAANDALVDDMITGLFNLTLAAASRPQDPNYDLAGLGLKDPPLTVAVSVDATKTRIKFGKPSAIDPSLRYFMIDNDPVIYIGLDSAAASFAKDLFQIRNRRLAILEIERLEKIELESRWEKAFMVTGPDGKRTSEIRAVYETSLMAKTEGRAGAPPRWMLVKADGQAAEEEVSGDKPAYAAHLVHAIICESFVDRADPKEYGLDQPDVRYRFSFARRAEPVVVALSCREVAEGPDKGKRRAAARVEGNDEIAIIKLSDYDRLLRRRNDYRRNILFDLDPAEIASIRIDNGISPLELVSTIAAGDPPPAPVWSVASPKLKALPPEDLHALVIGLLKLQVLDFHPSQPDLKPFGLNPPSLTVTLGLRRGDKIQPSVYAFGYVGEAEANVLRPGSPEITIVAADVFQQLDRGDLLARTRDVMLVPRADIKEVAVEFRTQDMLAPVYYMIRRTEAGAWEFANTELKGQEIDDRQVDLLLATVSCIQTEGYVSRRPERAEKAGVAGMRPPARLTLRCLSEGAAREYALNISEPREAVPGGGAIYYAKFEPTTIGERADDPFFQTVFRLRESFVELIKRGVKKRKAIDDGTPTPTPSSPTPTPSSPSPTPSESSK